MIVVFACGHRAEFTDGQRPACQTCGETRITTTTAPPPRFAGTVLGPCAVKGAHA